MHIPDGFLSGPVLATSWAGSLAAIGICLKKVKKFLKDKTVPLMGVMAAFIFAAQMLNFPIAGGTSGHLIGAVLATVLLGPYAAVIIMATVLTVQCLIFQDGGLTALGANILNMGVIGVFCGYFFYKFLKQAVKKDKGILVGSFFGAWFSVVLASVAASLELALSKTIPLKVVFLTMVSVHSLIGIGEGLITVAVIGFILKVRKDLIYS